MASSREAGLARKAPWWWRQWRQADEGRGSPPPLLASSAAPAPSPRPHQRRRCAGRARRASAAHATRRRRRGGARAQAAERGPLLEAAGHRPPAALAAGGAAAGAGHRATPFAGAGQRQQGPSATAPPPHDRACLGGNTRSPRLAAERPFLACLWCHAWLGRNLVTAAPVPPARASPGAQAFSFSCAFCSLFLFLACRCWR